MPLGTVERASELGVGHGLAAEREEWNAAQGTRLQRVEAVGPAAPAVEQPHEHASHAVEVGDALDRPRLGGATGPKPAGRASIAVRNARISVSTLVT